MSTHPPVPILFALPDGVALMSDPSPGDGVIGRLRPWGTESVRVASRLPDGFDAYARIFHPAYRVEGDVGTVGWSDMARARGASLRPDTAFTELIQAELESPEWDKAVPLEGSLPRPQMRSLVSILEGHTDATATCWFCFWDGDGMWWRGSHSIASEGVEAEDMFAYERMGEEQDRILHATPRVEAGSREYFLFRGPLATASGVTGAWDHSPNRWWPDDLAWCVATEIDDYSTYLGASRECIDRVLQSPEIEAIEVVPETRADPGP